MNVLIIDDSRTVCDQMTSFLAEMGHTADFCLDGREALEQIKIKEYQLLFVDINMAYVDGITFLKEASEMLGDSLPVAIMVTTEMDTELQKLAKSYGAKGWITKPVGDQKLSAIVRKVEASAR